MYKVGITGGIGSGKSIVCNVFRNLDVPVYEADTEARRMIAENPGIREQLASYFGKKIFTDNSLDRKYLAERIFADSKARSFVNRLVHPEVRKDFRSWAEKQDGPYVIKEAALLFESGAWKEMDFTILVSAREETRILRIIKRDGLERGKVLARLASQIDPEDAAKLADRIIYNDENEFVIPQVLETDRLLKERLSNKKG